MHLTCVLAAVLLAAHSSAQSLSNPDFEGAYTNFSAAPACGAIGGDVAPGWFDNSCWSGNTASQVAYSRSTTAPHSGLACQRIDFGGGGLLQFAQGVSLSAGQLHQAAIWMRASAPVEVEFLLRRDDPPYTPYLNRICALTPNWQRFELQGFAESADALLMIRCDEPATVFLDSASWSSAPGAATLDTSIVAPEYFGMHIHTSDADWPDAALGVRGVRIWDSGAPLGAPGGAQWADVNFAPGQYDWSVLDAHVARASARGADILYTLGRTPLWASARPNEATPYGPGQAAEPANVQHWRDWVGAVATRYRGVIRHWEIWNEPNDPNFYTGTVQTLVTLAQEAHALLKSIDPSNVVLSPSPYDVGYLERYLELGGGAFADVIGYHFYLGELDPEYAYTSYIPNVWLALQRQGAANKPLWNTEAGWALLSPFSAERQVGLVARSNLLARAAGAQRFFWYSWDPHAPSGVEVAQPPSYADRSVAGAAYGEIARWMRRARMLAIDAGTNGAWSVELLRTGGDRAWIVWHPGASAAAPASFNVPPAWGANWLRRLDGSLSPWNGGALALDGRPQLLEQESAVSSTVCSCASSAPCSNASAESGCRHSLGFGARLLVEGSSRASRDDLVLQCVDLPPSRPALLFAGQGGTLVPLAAGLRCVAAGNASPLLRFASGWSDASGVVRWGPGLIAQSQASFGALNGAFDGGETWRFQVWFRDAVNACSQNTNLSEAVGVSFY